MSICVRCQKIIKRSDSYSRKPRFLLEWKYIKSRAEVLFEVRKMTDLGKNAVVTHVDCGPSQVDGFDDRMRAALGVPPNTFHPLLI